MDLKNVKKLNPSSLSGVTGSFDKASIPNKPGCYQFLDKKGKII